MFKKFTKSEKIEAVKQEDLTTKQLVAIKKLAASKFKTTADQEEIARLEALGDRYYEGA